jgi:biopolymer transport protein ExbB
MSNQMLEDKRLENTGLLDVIAQGGFVMWPLLLCSVVAVAIVFERFWTLQYKKIVPPDLLQQVRSSLAKKAFDEKKLRELQSNSALGRVLAAGLTHLQDGRETLINAIDTTVNHEVHECERYLTALGTMAAITPLLGLLGTVLGMMDMFSSFVLQGNGNATVLAAGIAKALITTASGLFVAIPCLFFHRFFIRRVDEFAVALEQDALTLMDSISDRT